MQLQDEFVSKGSTFRKLCNLDDEHTLRGTYFGSCYTVLKYAIAAWERSNDIKCIIISLKKLSGNQTNQYSFVLQLFIFMSHYSFYLRIKSCLKKQCSHVVAYLL